MTAQVLPTTFLANQQRLVFLKLRKTGGTTFSASVLFPYCLKFGLKFMVPQKGARIFPGNIQREEGPYHMMFRHFPKFGDCSAKHWLDQQIGNFKLVTIVRDPISRAVSWYNHQCFYDEPMSFEQYLETRHPANHQSKWLGFDGRDPQFFSTNFTAVGLTERFNESMLLFASVSNMNMSDILYIPQRTDLPKRLVTAQLSDSTLARLRRVEHLDVKLYSQAQKTFSHQLSSLPDFPSELSLYEKALANFSHPLWARRGSFEIGYSAGKHWQEFDGRTGGVKRLRNVPQ